MMALVYRSGEAHAQTREINLEKGKSIVICREDRFATYDPLNSTFGLSELNGILSSSEITVDEVFDQNRVRVKVKPPFSVSAPSVASIPKHTGAFRAEYVYCVTVTKQ